MLLLPLHRYGKTSMVDYSKLFTPVDGFGHTFQATTVMQTLPRYLWHA